MMYTHLIEIEAYTSLSDGGGGYTKDWNTLLASVEAHVQPIGGTEYYQAQQLQNPVEVDIFTPYNGAIKPNMRVKYVGQIMNIKAVLDQGGLNEVLLLKCSIAG